MLVDPLSVVERLKRKSLKTIIKERNKLIEEIKHFEDVYILKIVEPIEKDLLEEDCLPSPRTRYSCNIDYLYHINKLIEEKYRKSIE